MSNALQLAAWRQGVNQVCEHISRLTGVQLGEKQRSMVTSRLKRRALDLKFKSLDEYLQYFADNSEAETPALVSLLTTHHSFFFREFAHFEYLTRTGLKAAVVAAKARGDNRLRVWSAACSRGQECYSLAMYLSHHLPSIDPSMGFEIVATDIDVESVAIARNGVYHRDDIKSVPVQYLGNHWQRGSGDIVDFVRAKNSLREHCRFEQQNLLAIDARWPERPFDLVFCRNVFIYFSREQVESISRQLLKRLVPDGCLFIGVSESLVGLNLAVKALGHSIYSPKRADVAIAPRPAEREEVAATAVSQPILRVLCVDDSPSVISLLKHILTPENGFRVVATAANGLEAAVVLKTIEVDLVTLDIHMPEQDGPTYLSENYGPRHPAVVMFSSVSRDSADLAMRCLALGATDYVEKPALPELKQRKDEILLKLRCAFETKRDGAPRINALDRSFSRAQAVSQPEQKRRLMLCSLPDVDKVGAVIREFSGAQPPTLIVLSGAGHAVQGFAKALELKTGRTVKACETLPALLEVGGLYVMDANLLTELAIRDGALRCSILVFGAQQPKSTLDSLSSFRKRRVVVEDTKRGYAMSGVVSDDSVPVSSFAYMSTEYLSGND